MQKFEVTQVASGKKYIRKEGSDKNEAVFWNWNDLIYHWYKNIPAPSELIIKDLAGNKLNRLTNEKF